jgi:hypothetical protein
VNVLYLYPAVLTRRVGSKRVVVNDDTFFFLTIDELENAICGYSLDKVYLVGLKAEELPKCTLQTLLPHLNNRRDIIAYL